MLQLYKDVGHLPRQPEPRRTRYLRNNATQDGIPADLLPAMRQKVIAGKNINLSSY